MPMSRPWPENILGEVPEFWFGLFSDVSASATEGRSTVGSSEVEAMILLLSNSELGLCAAEATGGGEGVVAENAQISESMTIEHRTGTKILAEPFMPLFMRSASDIAVGLGVQSYKRPMQMQQQGPHSWMIT